jgi:hypothetical protein
MNVPLIKAAISSVPVTAIFWYAMTVFARCRNLWAAVQLTGAAGLGVVVVAHGRRARVRFTTPIPLVWMGP